MTHSLWQHDLRLAESLPSGGRLVGLDEAGRGPLAGPVVAGAVVWGNAAPIPGIDDSKKLSESQREKLYYGILSNAAYVGVGLCTPAEIDRINILQASLLAMRRALAGCPFGPLHCLVDGKQEIPLLRWPQQAIVHGDGTSYRIACASIIAKVTRDRIMIGYHTLYPGFGFHRHKGYPVPEHLLRLRELGPTFLHRMSYEPLVNLALLPVEAS